MDGWKKRVKGKDLVEGMRGGGGFSGLNPSPRFEESHWTGGDGHWEAGFLSLAAGGTHIPAWNVAFPVLSLPCVTFPHS